MCRSIDEQIDTVKRVLRYTCETEYMQAVLETLQTVKCMQSMPQRIIADGEVNGPFAWRAGLDEINDILDRIIG